MRPFPRQCPTQHASDQPFTITRSDYPSGQRAPFRTHIIRQQAAQPQHALSLALGAQFCLRRQGPLLGPDFVQQLEVVERPDLSGADERHGVARATCPAGSTGTVDVRLGRFREGVVDHAGQVFYVDSTRRHVGGHQETDAAGPHARHDILALRLRQVGRDGLGVQTLAAQVFGHPAGFFTSVTENQRAFRILEGEHARKLGFALPAGDGVVDMADLVHAHEVSRQGH